MAITVDPAVYDAPTFDTTIPESAAAPVSPYVAPEPVPQRSILVGTPETAQANIVAQQNARQGVSASESAAAAVTEWDTTRLINEFTGPTFEPEPGFSPVERVSVLDQQLNETQREFLYESTSAAQLEYRIDAMDASRLNFQKIGDNPLIGYSSLMVDPVYLGIDIAAAGAGRIAAAAKIGNTGARTFAAGTAAAGAVGVLEVADNSRPVSTTELVTMALISGAAGAMFYNPKTARIEPSDPAYPKTELADIAQPTPSAQAGDDVVVTGVIADIPVAVPIQAADAVVDDLVPLVDSVLPTNLIDTAVAARTTPTVEPTLPRDLAGAKPTFGSSPLTFASDVDRAAYITSQTKPSKRDADYLKFVQDSTGMTVTQVRAHGSSVKASIKAQAKDAVPGQPITVPRQAKVGTTPASVKARAPSAQYVPATPGIPQSAKAELTRIVNNSKDPVQSALANRLSTLLDRDIPMGDVKGLTRSYYMTGEDAIFMRPSADGWTRMHEITHAMTAQRIRFGRRNPESQIGKLTGQLELMRQAARSSVRGKTIGQESRYYLNNLDEFVAGLYSGSKEFMALMKTVPGIKGAPSILSDFVTAVRQILGLAAKEHSGFLRALGLSDELMAQPHVAKSTHRDTTMLRAADMNGRPPAEVAERLMEHQEKLGGKIGRAVSISLHKTFSSLGGKQNTVAQRIANLLVDDPIKMSGDSVVSQQRAIRADLSVHQYKYEDLLKAGMAAQGFGTLKRIFTPNKALAIQNRIERVVMDELWAREAVGRTGVPHVSSATPQVKAMADEVDKMNAAALAEMQRAGVKGAEELVQKAGYVSRKWDGQKLNDLERVLLDSGMGPKAARAQIKDMVTLSLVRGNGWDDVLAGDVAWAILDRTRRKSAFEDSAFRSHAGNEAAAELRDILTGSGIRGDRLQRAMDMITGVADEAGKSPILKRRVELDMHTSMVMPDGKTRTVGDILNTDIARIQDSYLDHVAGRSALSRKGLGDTTAISSLRSELIQSIDNVGERGRAAELFDNVINAIQGNPVGEQMAQWVRDTAAVTRMVGLASSGLWQTTEYASAMQKYGVLSTMGYMAREMPGARKLFQNVSRDGSTATELHSVLTRNSSVDLRLRPFISKMEDNFDMAVSSQVSLGLNQAQQLVPYLNAQKYVQTHQARVVANLVIDSLLKAGKGDKRAINVWGQYGLEPHIVVEVQSELLKHGTDTAKWADATWDKVRGPLTKAMDEAVLRNRTGEIPAFAQFSQVGKFVFTFRSFVLGAHNKVLAGTLGRDGLMGLGLLMLYQLPLAMLAVQANAKIQNKPIAEGELTSKAISQMGSIGLFSEAWGVVTGHKQQFGAPGLIAIDRMYKTVGAAAAGNWGEAATTAVAATPILSIVPVIRGIGEGLKE